MRGKRQRYRALYRLGLGFRSGSKAGYEDCSGSRAGSGYYAWASPVPNDD